MFVLNDIQTQSGYCYNLGNELASMQGLVDIVRLSPQSLDTLPLMQDADCNGYWRRVAGLELVS